MAHAQYGELLPQREVLATKLEREPNVDHAAPSIATTSPDMTPSMLDSCEPVPGESLPLLS
jgi:hypothetical protein